MVNEIITIKNVKGYIKDETVMLSLEDVARGLGFITVATSGNEVIRWARVNEYLKEFSFPNKLGKDDYIPENIFYRLCFKAKNEVAQKFQSFVCDEVLPTIRKHGTYMTAETIEKTLTNPDFIIKLATELKTEQTKNKALQNKIETDKPKVLFSDSVSASESTILIGELAKILKGNGIDIGQTRLFQWMRDNGYLIKRIGTSFNTPTQKAMDLGLFRLKETSITHSDGHITVNKTVKVTGKGQDYFVNKFLNS